jgi:hypothetical protein
MGEDANEAGRKREEAPGHGLIDQIKELIRDGNAKAVRVKTEDGKVFLEVPLTPAAITGGVVVIAAPWLAVLAAIAGLVTRVRLEVVPEKRSETAAKDNAETPRAQGIPGRS